MDGYMTAYLPARGLQAATATGHGTVRDFSVDNINPPTKLPNY